MATKDCGYNAVMPRASPAGHRHNITLSTVTDPMDIVNRTTISSASSDLLDCGPSEFIFLFYAYYYGLMVLVTMIGVVGNTAVIRYLDLSICYYLYFI